MKRWLAGAILTICTLGCLFGCDYRELDELQMVAGSGVDFEEENIILTAETAIMREKGGDQPRPILRRSSGKTLTQAMQTLERQAEKELYWSHAQVLVVGQEAAKQVMPEILSVIRRNESMRLNLCLCVAKGRKAEEILSAGSESEEVRSFELWEGFRQNKEHAAVPDGAFFKAARLTDQGERALVPALALTEEKEPRPVFCGAAVLSEEGLEGFLDERETMLAMIAAGEGEGGVLSLLDGQMIFRIRSGSVRLEDAGQTIKMKVFLSGVLEDRKPGEKAGNGQESSAMIKEAERELAREFGMLIERGERELGMTFIGSAEAPHEKEYEGGERRTPVDPEVTLNITGGGMTSE